VAGLAIVIGIDRYESDLVSLKGAVADAFDVATWLIDSGAVAKERLHLGVLPADWSVPEPPTLAGCPRFEPCLDGLDDLLINLRKDSLGNVDRLFFTYSGHGAASSNPVYRAEALCLAGFAEGKWRKALELASLMQTLKALPVETRFIWIDGCRDPVKADTAQFGRLSESPAPDDAIPRDYVLRATPAGRKAAEASGRGLFTRHLIQGLAGAGAAKRFDPELARGAGGYAVRWLSLVEHVTTSVAALPAAQRREQLVTRVDEAPGHEDPCLATFEAGAFPDEEVEVSVTLSYPGSPVNTEVIARRDGSADEATLHLESGKAATLRLAPSAWTILARAPGYRTIPKQFALPVYGPGLTRAFELQPVPRAVGGTTFGFGKRPPAPSAPDTGSGPATLNIRIGGWPPSVLSPRPRIRIRQDSGRVIENAVLSDRVELGPGLYIVSLETPDGRNKEVPVALEADEDGRVDLDWPASSTPPYQQLLDQLGRGQEVPGVSMPSEAAGLLLGASMGTAAILGVGRRVSCIGGSIDQLGLGLAWQSHVDEGVSAIIAMEEEGCAPEPRVRLWAMQATNHDQSARLRLNTLVPAIAEAALPAAPGHYWLELRDADREERRGFTLATRVLPGHVTLVVRAENGLGVDLVMVAARRQPDDLGFLLRSLVNGEALQLARASGRDPIQEPLVRELADGRWFEPFSAIVAGAALVGREGPAIELLAAIIGRLDAAEIGGPDVLMLKAALADDKDTERTLVREALDTGVAPVADKLLQRLETATRRFRLFGPTQQWIAEKRAQSTGHPLWTLRRHDDN
jgi:hypothetical protein